MSHPSFVFCENKFSNVNPSLVRRDGKSIVISFYLPRINGNGSTVSDNK